MQVGKLFSHPLWGLHVSASLAPMIVTWGDVNIAVTTTPVVWNVTPCSFVVRTTVSDDSRSATADE
jgi:hypothetical protein